MAALAGFGAGMEVKAPKAPPALFPKFVVEEPGDFPCLKSPPPNKEELEMITLQRALRAIHKSSPYHTKPPSQEKDVVRYSDALKRNEEEVLGLLLHSRSRYLPRELRAAPLATNPIGNEPLDGDGFMDFETLLSGVGDVPALATFHHHPIAGMPAELTRQPDSAASPSPAKRKRSDGDDAGGKEAKQQKKKAKKEDAGGATKRKAAAAGVENSSSDSSKTELDFSNLTKHKLVELRNFCRENGIQISSRNKQGYADAIAAWQKSRPKPAAAAPPAKTQKTETAARVVVAGSSDKAAAAATREKGKEKAVGEDPVPAKAGEAGANGGKLPRPLDRMSRLAQLEEEGLEEDEEGNPERNKSRLMEEEDDEDENDYNERYDSEAEEDDDDDEDNEPTF